MQSPEVTDYIKALDQPKRDTLQRLRELVHSIEPELEEVIAWRAPMFRLRGNYPASEDALTLGFCR